MRQCQLPVVRTKSNYHENCIPKDAWYTSASAKNTLKKQDANKNLPVKDRNKSKDVSKKITGKNNNKNNKLPPLNLKESQYLPVLQVVCDKRQNQLFKIDHQKCAPVLTTIKKQQNHFNCLHCIKKRDSHPVQSVNCKLDLNQNPGQKKKGLGEFTHFPHLYNISIAKPFFLSSFNTKLMDTQNQNTDNTMENKQGKNDNKKSRHPLTHSVSIVVDEVEEKKEKEFGNQEVKKKDTIQSIMDAARLRKEEFARLLDEHAAIINEIKKAENSMIY